MSVLEGAEVEISC